MSEYAEKSLDKAPQRGLELTSDLPKTQQDAKGDTAMAEAAGKDGVVDMKQGKKAVAATTFEAMSAKKRGAPKSSVKSGGQLPMAVQLKFVDVETDADPGTFKVALRRIMGDE